MPAYRLFADDAGMTHLEPLDLNAIAFEAGPGAFKGIGGTVLGTASRVTLMRFEPGGFTPAHRAIPAFAVLLQGTLVVEAADGASALLERGDAVRIEVTARGSWKLGNPGEQDALFALVPMPPASAGE